MATILTKGRQCSALVTAYLAKGNGSLPLGSWLCYLRTSCHRPQVQLPPNALIKYGSTFAFSYVTLQHIPTALIRCCKMHTLEMNQITENIVMKKMDLKKVEKTWGLFRILSSYCGELGENQIQVTSRCKSSRHCTALHSHTAATSTTTKLSVTTKKLQNRHMNINIIGIIISLGLNVLLLLNPI